MYRYPMTYFSVTGSLLLAGWIISFALTPLIIRLAMKKGILDQPDIRKTHTTAVPRLGGIALAVSCLVPYVLVYGTAPGSERLLLFGTIIVLLTGAWDDLRNLRPWIKLGLQLVAAVLAVDSGYHLPTSYFSLLPASATPVVRDAISIVFIVLIMNAMNLIDGVDGLAGTLGGTGLLVAGHQLLGSGHLLLSFACLSTSGGVFAFLLFNIRPARIFMGDTGSLLIGYLLAVASLALFEPLENGSLQPGTVQLVLAINFLPVLDAMRVALERISKGLHPFRADRTHVHHLMMDIGVEPGRITLVLLFIHIGLLSFALAYRPAYFPATELALLAALGSGLLFYELQKKLRTRRSYQRVLLRQRLQRQRNLLS